MSDTTYLDAVVIGAGFGGIYMLHTLRNGLGFKVRAYDEAGGVGGTWYWSKYPGRVAAPPSTSALTRRSRPR
jgi:cyclohexanone monooxygenase